MGSNFLHSLNMMVRFENWNCFECNHIQYLILKIINIQYSKSEISFRGQRYSIFKIWIFIESKRTCYAARIGVEWWTSSSQSSCNGMCTFYWKDIVLAYFVKLYAQCSPQLFLIVHLNRFWFTSKTLCTHYKERKIPISTKTWNM